MASISRSQLLKELLPGLNALFGLEYDKYQDEHLGCYDEESSDRSFEEETKLSGFGAAPVKKEGGSLSYDTAQESFTQRYDHETIAMGFSITEEAMEDNLYDSLSSRYTKALARAMNYTKQVKAMVPFNTGFTATTGYLSGDGDPLFSTSHSIVNGADVSNRPATATDLNETSLEDAAIQISNWTDERGLLVAAQPTKLIIPTNLHQWTVILIAATCDIKLVSATASAPLITSLVLEVRVLLNPKLLRKEGLNAPFSLTDIHCLIKHIRTERDPNSLSPNIL